MLSILMYPAVWSVESAIWQRDYENDLVVGRNGSMSERFECVFKAREECYEVARNLVKEELRNRTSGVNQHDMRIAESEFQEFVLMDNAGNKDLVALFSKDDWEMLWTICSRSDMSNAVAMLVHLTTLDLQMRLSRIVMEKYYVGLLGSDPGSTPSEELAMKLELDNIIFFTSRTRLFHCMD